MDTAEKFLSLFHEIEIHLRIEYSQGRFSESSFMGTLLRIKAKKENDLIATKGYFSVLSQAAQIRNIMVHNDGIAIPTEAFLEKFEKVVTTITRPKTVYEIMKPIKNATTVSLNLSIQEVIDIMKEKKFSNIPVVDNHRLKGVFTERTLFYYMLMNNDGVINKTMLMRDILTAMDLDNDPAQYFAFISKTSDVYAAIELFSKDSKNDKELEILFVTEQGLPHEAILGIVTHWDLNQAFLDFET